MSADNTRNSIANSPEKRTFPLRALPSTDSKFRAYDLSGGESWGLAYDELSGHMAVTSDKAGVLVYDIDNVLREELHAQVVPLKGTPSGVCFKNWRMQRLFLAIQADRNEIAVIDAETLTQIDVVSVPGPLGFARIACSSDSDDPYVYCLTVPNTKDDTWTNRIVRVDLSTETSRFTSETFGNIATSFDGLTLLCQSVDTEGQYLIQHFRPYESTQIGKLEMEFLYAQKPIGYPFAPTDLRPNTEYFRNPALLRTRPHYPRACFE